MEDSVNYAEYTVEQKAEGKNLYKKILFVILYLLFGLGVPAFFLFGPIKIWPLGAIMPLLTFIVVGLTWRYVSLEHRYEIINAKLRISEIYGRKKQETVFENLVSEFSLIAPMTDEYREQWEKADRILDYRGSKKTPDGYFARLEKDGKSTVVYFEAVNKMLKIMKFYNSKSTVVTTMRY
ncbi:MAG: hypothetical protein ACI4V1_00750 [Eubacteriales bacterium]